jgi:DNA repair exonuclease SbcCD nuclease subunit
MNALIISDLHMHKWQYGSRLTEQGYNSRLWYLYQALLQVKEHAESNEVDAVFVTGDIFHTHDKVDVQTLFLTAVGLMEIAKVCSLYLLVGNHDMASMDGEIHALKAFESFATIIDKPMKFEVTGKPIIAHPYTKDMTSLYDFLDTAEEGSLGLVHQGVAGASLGSSWIPDESFGVIAIPKNIEMIFAGHYHVAQNFSASRIIIPGSIAPHTWADHNYFHGSWIYNSDDQQTTTTIGIDSPDFVEFGWQDSYLDYAATNGDQVDLINGNFIRVVNCPLDLDAKKAREVFFSHGCEAIELVYENEIGVQTTDRMVKTGDFSIEPLLEEYEKIQMPNRRKQIGKLIREFRYEVPKG